MGTISREMGRPEKEAASAPSLSSESRLRGLFGRQGPNGSTPAAPDKEGQGMNSSAHLLIELSFWQRYNFNGVSAKEDHQESVT